MKGKWTDILINVRYTRKEDGVMKVWINNKLILESLNIKTFTPYKHTHSFPIHADSFDY